MVVIVDCMRGKQRYENLRTVVGFVGGDGDGGGGGGWLFFQVVVAMAVVVDCQRGKQRDMSYIILMSCMVK